MKVVQTGVFRRRVKKLHAPEKKRLDTAVRKIIKDPSVGKQKIGDLAHVQVYKFKHKTQQYLLSYGFDLNGQILTLLALGTHENFYRDLKT